MEVDENFGDGLAGGEVDDGDRAFVGDVADGIDFDNGPPPCRADEIAGTRTAAAPIADVGFAGSDHDIVRRDADRKCARDFARGEIDFEKLVGKIGADVEFGAVGREREAGGNFFFAARGVCVRDGDGVGRSNFVVRDTEDFDAAVDIREVELRAVFGKDEAGEAELALGVWLENVRGRRGGLRFVLAFVGERNALEDGSSGGINDDEFAGFAGGDENFSIGREREALRAEAREIDLRAERRDGLVDGENDFGALAADVFAARRCGVTGGDQREEEQQRLHADGE